MKKIGREHAAGVDVSAHELHVCVEGDDGVGVYANDVDGHRELLTRLTRRRRSVRVVVEATGTYHLDLALALIRHPRVRVSVQNPRATKAFHAAQNIRAKTDRVDARSLCEFAKRMEFVEWTLPDEVHLEFRGRVRHIEQLILDETRLKNRLTALAASQTSPRYVREQSEQYLAFVKQQLSSARADLNAFEEQHEDIHQAVSQLSTVPGLGRATAQRLAAAFLFLDEEMTSKQITAWAGLDPQPRQSGTSLNGQRSISKRGNARVRSALYMCAVTASRSDSPMGQHYRRVAAKRPNKVGLVAVMRKLLIVGWAVHRTQAVWDATKASPHTPRQLPA